MRSLIVDDDRVCRMLLTAVLSRGGAISQAATGAKAVAAVARALHHGEPFALITLDIMMPDMDGHAALAEIRRLESEHEGTPIAPAFILMTSSLGDGRNVGKAFGAHCDGYLTKPVELDRLVALLVERGLIPA